MIRNPVLRGFNPDPSICRVGDEVFIATSTFEWFPGVQIHRSRDLARWELAARPLTRASQLDMRGDPDSCGVWAPDLTFADGQFWLIYTDVKRYGRTTMGGASGASLRDFHNYLVTAPAIEGPWSDPVRLNSSGFDPSLFHDEDGRCYLLNMLWDHRPGRPRFAGIVLQEYDADTEQLVGERSVIFPGTALGLTEAPHLYRRDGWYYLLVAEGGTGWNHAVTMARSRSLRGPYELHPDGPVLTSRDRPDAPLHRAGHADLVEMGDGSWWMAYLCGRPLPGRGRCVMGRETAIQPVVWGEDGWLRTVAGDAMPQLEVPSSLSPTTPGCVPTVQRRRFDVDTLPSEFQWLRSPEPERLWSLSARPGYLRLWGRETLGSLFEQALVARRQEAFCYSAATRMTFMPEHFQQAAGLICYYNSIKFHYLHVTHDEEIGRHLRVMSALPDSPQADSFTAPVAIPDGDIELAVEVDFERLRFGWRPANDGDVQTAWRWLPELFDASILSDEASTPGLPNFTGAFVGVACQDMAGTARAADFAWFEYRERPFRSRVGEDVLEH